MYKQLLKRMSFFIVTMMSAVIITGCADMGQYSVYRTYYRDSSNCGVYYINNLGQRVYVGVHNKYTPHPYQSEIGVYRDGYYSNNAWHFYRHGTCI